MAKKQSIKMNFLYQAFYEILVLALPLLTSPYISRVLGASNIGIYSYTYTIANYFVLFAALGIKNYGNREISRNKDNRETLNKTFSGILFLHFTISAIALIGYFGYYLIARPEYKTYVMIQSLYVIAAFFDISWFFFGMELFKTTVMRNTAIKVVSVVCIFIFVRQPSDLWKYVLILAVSNFAGQIYLWFKLKPLVSIVSVGKEEIFRHLPQMSILFIPTIAVSLYNYMDKVMLGAMSGTIELGFYENAFKITTIGSTVVGSVGTVMLPRMSNLVANGRKEESRKYISISMEFVMIMAYAMAFGIAAVSDIFAPVFWGREFLECGPLLLLMGIVIPVKGFANVLRTQYLIPNRRDKEYTCSLCCGALCNLIANFILIPTLGAIGATVATVAAEVAVAIVQAVFTAKEIPVKQYLLKTMPYFIAGMVMLMIVRGFAGAMEATVISLLVLIMMGAIIYLGLVFTYLVVTKNQILKFVKNK